MITEDIQNAICLFIFIMLCVEGIKRLKIQTFSLMRLGMGPVAVCILSAHALLHHLGLTVGHFALYTSGFLISAILTIKTTTIIVFQVYPRKKLLTLPGSSSPLCLYIIIFCIKYLTAALFNLPIIFSQNMMLLGVLAFFYGSLSGSLTGHYLLIRQQFFLMSSIPVHHSEQSL